MGKRGYTSAKAKEALLKDKDKFCGECCWFYAEDTDGYGVCPFRFAELQRCSDKCPISERFVSKEEMRHHMAVLLQANRYRRDDNVPPIYRMPDQKELGLAIDFAYRYMKIFGEL
jgi:hypothetical protein